MFTEEQISTILTNSIDPTITSAILDEVKTNDISKTLQAEIDAKEALLNQIRAEYAARFTTPEVTEVTTVAEQEEITTEIMTETEDNTNVFDDIAKMTIK